MGFEDAKLKKASAKQLYRKNFFVALILSDVASIAAAFVAASFLRLGFLHEAQVSVMLAVTIPIFLAAALGNKAYNVGTFCNFWVSLSRSTLSLIFTVSVVVLVAFFFKASAEFSRVILAVGVILSLILMIGGRWIISHWGKRLFGNNPVAELIIEEDFSANGHPDTPVIEAISFGIVPSSNDHQAIEKLGLLVESMDRIIVYCQPERRSAWAFTLKALDVNGEIVVPELNSLAPQNLHLRDGNIALEVSQGPLIWHERLLKRSFDVCFAALALLVMAIPMAILAFVIRFESRGPILFRQRRIGLANRPFNIMKFRSMRTEETDVEGSQSTSRKDERLTRVGAFIRRTSIDELPQLFNILKGDMSIVGPRPHSAGSTAEGQFFWDIDEQYWHRHSIKPGLTGLAQVRGFRGATEKKLDLESRLNSDLDYRANWSLWRDIKIVLLTFRVLMHRNAF